MKSTAVASTVTTCLCFFLAMACRSFSPSGEGAKLAEITMNDLPPTADPSNSKLSIKSSTSDENLSIASLRERKFTAGIEYTFGIQLFNAKNELIAQTKDNDADCAPVKKTLLPIPEKNDVKIVACKAQGNNSDPKSNPATPPNPNMTTENTVVVDEAGLFMEAFFKNIENKTVDLAYKVFTDKQYVRIEKSWPRYILEPYAAFAAQYGKKTLLVSCSIANDSPKFSVEDAVKITGRLEGTPTHGEFYLEIKLKDCTIEKLG